MNSFGKIFRVSIFGESHGPAVGIVLDGCPAGIPLSTNDFKVDMGRRKSGSPGTTARKEPDLPKVMSGLHDGHTTGAPLTIVIDNTNVRPADYSNLKDTPRPGHADFVASKKFGGFEDRRGGGHFSGRLTAAMVAAGVIAKKIISPVNCAARVIELGGMEDHELAVKKAIEGHDSIGGIIECVVTNVPAGLGEPFFDSVESVISHMIFSIPAIKGIEFGSGFRAARMKGSEHNDNIIDLAGTTETNHSGGINGGITNGNELVFRVAVKPTSSTSRSQRTMNMKTGKVTDLVIGGRHDACIALRVPVVLEAAAAIVMADFMMLEQQVDRIKKDKK
jgi:chorismate synthase